MKPITGAAAVALALTLTACAGSSSGGGTGATSGVPADTSAAGPATPDVPSGHPKTACAAFGYFYSDLTTYTPHAVSLLIADAGRVQSLAKTEREVTDATALVAAVSSASWDSSGSVDDPAVAKMQADCP